MEANVKISQPSGKSCCYGFCTSSSRRNEHDLFYFMPFPKPCTQFRNKYYKGSSKKHVKNCLVCLKSERWISLCRPKFGKSIENIPTKAFLCSLHFVGASGPSTEHPDPIQNERKRKMAPIRTSLEEKYKRSNSGTRVVVTHPMEPIGETFTTNLNSETLNSATHHLPMQSFAIQSANVSFKVNVSTQTEDLLEKEKHVVSSNQNCSTQTESDDVTKRHSVNQCTQTVFTIFPYMKRLERYTRKYKEMKTKLKENRPEQKFERSVRDNNKQCLFYTGLTFQHIMILINFLGPSVNKLVYWKSSANTSTDSATLTISTNLQNCTDSTHYTKKVKRNRKLTPLQELFIVLMRLRRGFLVKDLAYRFNLSSGQISKLTATWVRFMYDEFSKMRKDMFPSRKSISETLPAIFKRLKNIRVLVDCTELFCQSPSNFEHQGNLYSSYKAHTTFKVLIGCTPNGAISYVSKLYEGAISDRELFDKCEDLKDWLQEGDLVLADRGFTIDDILEPIGVSLNIPPFLKGRKTLTAQEEMETKRIAKQRIYVEHVVGRLKRYRLLNQILPLNMRDILTEIVFVCACLVNFQPPILLD